jgi:PKD repeat protein
MQRRRGIIISRSGTPGRAPRLLLLALVVGVLAFPAVAQAAPTACFTQSPAAPYFTNTTITFDSSCSTGNVRGRAWEFDNTNDFNDGTGVTATRTYTTAGTYTVKLGVVDSQNQVAVTTKTITIQNRPPVSSFTFSPSAPASGQAVTFTSTSTDADGTVASQAWEFDNTNDFNDGTGKTATKTFATPGTYTAKLRVTDNSGAQHTSSQTVTVSNRAPSAVFTFSPAAPTTGQAVTFTSSSSDSDGTVASQAWEFDNTNDFNDATGTTVSRTYSRPGTYVVKLLVTDNSGAQTLTSAAVKVANRPPVASFVHSPANPVAGDPVTLTSTAADADGTVASQAWDLNGDGQFNDGTATTATFTPATAGTYPVGLRVTDDSGESTVSTQTLVVSSRPAGQPPADSGTGTVVVSGPRTDAAPFDTTGPSVTPPPVDPVAPIAPLRWLDPFPVVRIRGTSTRKGAKLTLLSVTAPGGSLAELRCSGRSCPAKSLRGKVKASRGKATGVVRFKRMERYLPAGTKIQVAVTQKDMVGKYTRFTIRRLALPARTDRCVLPGSSRPVACPVTP